jgi:AAA family ATP:ADP antiporter
VSVLNPGENFMKERLFKLLGVETGEESMVSMLLAQSVFLGIFFGAFDISAHSLFLSIFDEKMMARGYVVSGLVGIILTSIYTTLQTRMAFRTFAISNLFFVAVATLLLWLLLLLNPAKWVIFLVFIMLGPLNILAMLGFWGTTGRLFSLRQGKRLFGLVDAGLIVGIIISCYSIPVLLAMNFRPHNILLISAAAVLTGCIMQILIGSRFLVTTVKAEKEPEETNEKKSLLSVFRHDPYIRIMGIFIALSVMTAFFVQYSFMAVTREQYPSEEDMARFLGLFTGSMMIFTLLIKLLVFSYLIRNYGLRTCLAISPVLVAAFTLIAVLLGTFMGYTPAAGGFMLFFMLLALSRLFSKALKDSIESPSFKVIYQTLDEKIRYEIQSGMDGTVNEIAALTSGLLLAGLGILSFIKLIHFSCVLLVLTLIWIFVAVKLYSEYRKSIRNALESGSLAKPEKKLHSGAPLMGSRFSADLSFKKDYYSLVSGELSVIDNKSRHYYQKILDHSASTDDINLIPALKRIAEDKKIDDEFRECSAKAVESLELLSSSSSDRDDRLLSAKKILAGSRQPQTTLILRLLRDTSLDSRRLAINMIGKFKLTDLLPEVCDCLSIPGLEENAENVLMSFGKESSGELQRYYMVSSGNINISKSILRILGSSPSKEHESFLFSRLWSNSRQVKEVAMKCLIDRNYKVPDEEKDRLHQYISDIIGIITWNVAARISITKRNDNLLLEAINREINRWNTFLFNLLCVTYDSGSINRIRENLESGTVESVNYALEMIDLAIDDSIKPKLIPLLDVIPDEEKVKSLYQFFPGEIPDHKKLIEDIINRDYNMLGIWIRACAIRNTSKIDNPDLTESLIALLFSPEQILREEASKLIARSDLAIYRSVSKRLPAGIKERLEKIIDEKILPDELLFEKVRFLSTVFEDLSEEDLLYLAGALQFTGAKDSSVLPVNDRYINWSNYLLPLDPVEEYLHLFPENSSGIMKYIEINEI